MDEEKIGGQFLSVAEAMKLAILEARRGFAQVSPNPPVGCVILDAEGRLLSRGHHAKFGGPHAEVNALAGLAPEKLRGAEVFVTLEPCAHEGKTPSCAKMLAKLPLRRVVYGLQDPNPLVQGQGAAHLRERGVPCVLFSDLHGDALASELEESCEAFLWNHRHKSVFVSLKIACSLDGQIAFASGDSKWITGEESRREVHRLRACHDGVMVGSGTVMADDPGLDVRREDLQKDNVAIVLDPSGRLRGRHDSFRVGRPRPGRTLWIEGIKDPAEVLRRLWDEGLRSVMIEGGAQVASAFLRENLVNRLHLFQAPVLFGNQGRLFSEFFRAPGMPEKLELKQVKSLSFGPDSYTTGLLRST